MIRYYGRLMMGLLMDESARRSYDAEKSGRSPVLGQSYSQASRRRSEPYGRVASGTVVARERSEQLLTPRRTHRQITLL